MNFYVGAGLNNFAEADQVADALIALGHEQTYRWSIHGSVQENPELWATTAMKEYLGVRVADFVVIILPGGRGTHTELGIALGTKKKIFLIGPETDPRTCIFYHHPTVTRCENIYDLLEKIKAFYI